MTGPRSRWTGIPRYPEHRQVAKYHGFKPRSTTGRKKHESRISNATTRKKQLVTRVNSTNVLDKGLMIGGRATTRDSEIEIGTRRTQVHVPAVEDRYILLAI
jgi:hypothetical protein